jgi:hypothetical protein
MCCAPHVLVSQLVDRLRRVDRAARTPVSQPSTRTEAHADSKRLDRMNLRAQPKPARSTLFTALEADRSRLLALRTANSRTESPKQLRLRVRRATLPHTGSYDCVCAHIRPRLSSTRPEGRAECFGQAFERTRAPHLHQPFRTRRAYTPPEPKPLWRAPPKQRK